MRPAWSQEVNMMSLWNQANTILVWSQDNMTWAWNQGSTTAVWERASMTRWTPYFHLSPGPPPRCPPPRPPRRSLATPATRTRRAPTTCREDPRPSVSPHPRLCQVRPNLPWELICYSAGEMWCFFQCNKENRFVLFCILYVDKRLIIPMR